MLSLLTLALVTLSGCASAPRTVRLDIGQGTPLVHTPRGGQEAVRLREDEFKGALTWLARDVRPAPRPLRHARELMFESWQQEVYLEWTGRRLEPSVHEERAARLTLAPDELTCAYGRWCQRKGRPQDCLTLLKEGTRLDADGRYTLAMAIATDAVWEETKEAFADMVDPEAVRATVVSAMAMYMTLWLLPEPFSKGVAATLTAALIAYVGVDTFWGLIVGFKQLVEEANRATTFNELRDAGERYGRVMGRNAARAFVLLATAAIGNTAGLAVKGPRLPGFPQASVLAEAQGGFRLMALNEVQSVAISAEGAFTIALAPGAVAMTAQGPGGGSSSSGKTSVYLSEDKASKQVQYVGITDKVARRALEHLRLKGIKIEKLMGNLSREDARAVEQALIEIHGLIKNGGTLMNRINSIARSNPTYATQLQRGLELLESVGYTGP